MNNNMDINKEEVGVSTLRRYLYLVQIHNLALARHSPVIGERPAIIMHEYTRALSSYSVCIAVHCVHAQTKHTQ